MTAYILINSVITFVAFLSIFYLFYQHKKSEKSLQKNQNEKAQNNIGILNWKIYLLLFFVFILVVIAVISPFILTRPSINKDFDFSETGQIGDTIGGLMNPFIALAGVIVTGLAFYIQYKANLQQRELFLAEQAENQKQLQQQIDNQNLQNKIQQFESQFYEMLKLHRENITEMRIEGYDFEEDTKNSILKRYQRITEGRKIFVVMKTEFECILSIYCADKQLDEESFHKCYRVFFSGIEEFEREYPNEKDFIKILRLARSRHENPSATSITKNHDRKVFTEYSKLYFNYKPFSGHASRVGHYFRHLYLAVKSVANSDIIVDYDERMKYLKMLRAQLSNHEQIMLFYNWLSEFGYTWENEENAFFTEYSMIHNLWHHDLFESSFIKESVHFLRMKKVIFRKGNMFEID